MSARRWAIPPADGPGLGVCGVRVSSWTGTSSNACGTAPTGATSYAYDHAGNQTTGSLGYDALSRMTSVGSSTLSYLTPGAQELIGYASNTYHNALLGLDRETLSGVTTGYTRQPDGTPVAQRTSTTKQYLFGDRLGSITALADDNANSLTRTYSYDPDGNRTSSTTGTGSGVVTDLGFAAGHLLPNSMYHYGARFYDPSLARWTQEDPLAAVASQQNANRYAYVGGNPVNATDPSGMCLIDVACGEQKKALKNLKTATVRTASQVAGCVGAARAVAPIAMFYGPYGEAAVVGGACIAGAAGLGDGITKAAGNR
jgi:RHS repeat-associated protein